MSNKDKRKKIRIPVPQKPPKVETPKKAYKRRTKHKNRRFDGDA